MILCWMKHSLMTLVIISGSSLRVTGERHILQTNQAAGCQQCSLPRQVNSITPWTQMNGLVFTCDICSVALQSNSILPEYNWTEFTTQDALHVMLVYVFMATGEIQVVKRIQTFHSTDKSRTHGGNNEVYSEYVLLPAIP